MARSGLMKRLRRALPSGASCIGQRAGYRQGGFDLAIVLLADVLQFMMQTFVVLNGLEGVHICAITRLMKENGLVMLMSPHVTCLYRQRAHKLTALTQPKHYSFQLSCLARTAVFKHIRHLHLRHLHIHRGIRTRSDCSVSHLSPSSRTGD